MLSGVDDVGGRFQQVKDRRRTCDLGAGGQEAAELGAAGRAPDVWPGAPSLWPEVWAAVTRRLHVDRKTAAARPAEGGAELPGCQLTSCR